MTIESKRAVIAMSGGVDSAVAAYRMCRAGYDCVGVTLRLCGSSAADEEDAAAVCRALGIPHQVLDFRDAFHDRVMIPFANEYAAGHTPNPCVVCNREIKLGMLYRWMKETGGGVLATGHYVRITEENGVSHLERGTDSKKDQSYMLCLLPREILPDLRFPLGELTKEEVRTEAAEAGIAVASKHDSQDICFVPDGRYAEVVEGLLGMTFPEGAFLADDGHELGRHRGVIRYTVGQRKGLGLSLPAPLYVSALNVADNTVTLSDESALFRTELTACGVNWLEDPASTDLSALTIKPRYTASPVSGCAEILSADRLRVRFDAPVRAVTPGQYAVLYSGERVVAGGTIE